MSDSQAFIAAYAEAQHEIIALKQQNRELLEALERMCELYPPTTIARDLIAKHKEVSHG